MNEVISKKAVVLYRIQEEYGWRWAREYLPKNAQVVSMIALADGQATAVRYDDPALRTSTSMFFDEIATAVLAKNLESGKLPSWVASDAAYRKREVAQSVANFLATLYDMPSMSMALLALDVDNIVQYLTTETDNAMASSVCTTLRGADLKKLKKHAEACEQLLEVLPAEWRYQLLITTESERWMFWNTALCAVFSE
jgi:DNA polymerase III delta subunit